MYIQTTTIHHQDSHLPSTGTSSYQFLPQPSLDAFNSTHPIFFHSHIIITTTTSSSPPLSLTHSFHKVNSLHHTHTKSLSFSLSHLMPTHNTPFAHLSPIPAANPPPEIGISSMTFRTDALHTWAGNAVPLDHKNFSIKNYFTIEQAE
uniref:Uncharacterized protein n=1 Tax=Octopus bimaculoides TaxID=37653 RepID=A0A0L8HAB7_OCTBM